MTTLEVAANGVTTLAILLAGRNSIHTWWTGIIGAVLFGILFYQTKLYADVTLQGFFIATGVLGWMRWRRGRTDPQLPVGRIKPLALVPIGIGGVLVTLGYGTLLHRFTDAYAPFWDSLILVASVIAQFLLIGRKIETWYFWLLVNIVAVPLYLSRDLWLTSGLYVAYLINAVIALRVWRRELA